MDDMTDVYIISRDRLGLLASTSLVSQVFLIDTRYGISKYCTTQIPQQVTTTRLTSLHARYCTMFSE